MSKGLQRQSFLHIDSIDSLTVLQRHETLDFPDFVGNTMHKTQQYYDSITTINTVKTVKTVKTVNTITYTVFPPNKKRGYTPLNVFL